MKKIDLLSIIIITLSAIVIVCVIIPGCTSDKNPILDKDKALTSNIPQDLSIYTLNSGKSISYKEYGTKDGTPVFYFHGFPGSYIDVELFKKENLLSDMNIRLIALNRPGYSYSENQEERSLRDWVEVTKEVSNYLKLDKFSILAYSGGAPFAYTCGAYLPERINKIIIVSGMTPADAPEAKKGSAMIIPKAPGLILKGMYKLQETKPQKFKANFIKGLPDVDQKTLEDPKAMKAMIETVGEGMRNGISGAYMDAKIYKSDWGFRLNDVTTPVILYHGELDQNVKVESAVHVTENLPDCKSYILPDEGHISLIYNHTSEILNNLK